MNLRSRLKTASRRGVLIGTGGTADYLKSIIEKMHRGPGKVVYHKDPKRLIAEVIKLINKDQKMKTEPSKRRRLISTYLKNHDRSPSIFHDHLAYCRNDARVYCRRRA